tara:strand:- start:11182 stop:11319 length:138 start_codon:yes stop_codon:yes gene_type:complete
MESYSGKNPRSFNLDIGKVKHPAALVFLEIKSILNDISFQKKTTT